MCDVLAFIICVVLCERGCYLVCMWFVYVCALFVCVCFGACVCFDCCVVCVCVVFAERACACV